MLILVTGAGGFFGNHLARRLLENGYQVRGYVHHRQKAYARLQDVWSRLEIVEGEINARESLLAAMQGVDAVVHLVAVPIEKGDATYERINIRGTRNVVEAAEQTGIRRLINMSTNNASPHHPSPFLRSKGIAQEYVAHSHLNWTELRPSLAFGPEDVLFNSIAQLARLFPLAMPLVQSPAHFQPVWIQDILSVVLRCLEDENTIHQEYDLGGPERLTLREIYQRVLGAMQIQRVLVTVPPEPLMLPTNWMGKLLPGSPIDDELLGLMMRSNVVSQNALTEIFGITPASLAGSQLDYVRQASALEAIQHAFTDAAIVRNE